MHKFIFKVWHNFIIKEIDWCVKIRIFLLGFCYLFIREKRKSFIKITKKYENFE